MSFRGEAEESPDLSTIFTKMCIKGSYKEKKGLQVQSTGISIRMQKKRTPGFSGGTRGSEDLSACGVYPHIMA